MYSELVAFGLAATAMAKAVPQGVTQSISPKAPAPAGCQLSYPNPFQITTLNATQSKSKRQDSGPGQLILTLNNGQLKNNRGGTGYIAANYQFQFDNPPQTGAIYTAGFSVCGNGSLALGGSTIFYSCNSGGFNNLYDRSWAPQCSPVYINTLPSSAGGSSGGASQATDMQPQASTRAGVSQVSDMQPQASTRAGVSQISDQQPQAKTTAPKPITMISDQQPQAQTNPPKPAITQIGDMQPQAPTSAPKPAVTQIGDMQPQAPSSAPKPAVTQIGDMQPQAPSSAPKPAVTQIGDMQPQAPSSAPKPAITQIGDMQPQAPKSAGTPVGTPAAAAATARFTGGAAAPTGMANFALAGAAVVGAVFL